MKKLISLCLAMTMLLGSMVGCGKTPTSSSGNPSNSEGGGLGTPQTFKFGLTVASTHTYSIAAQNFAELVEEKSGGNMTVDLYYDSSLGDDAADGVYADERRDLCIGRTGRNCTYVPDL